jgi:hypothetical protein
MMVLIGYNLKNKMVILKLPKEINKDYNFQFLSVLLNVMLVRTTC